MKKELKKYQSNLSLWNEMMKGEKFFDNYLAQFSKPKWDAKAIIESLKNQHHNN